MNAEIRQEYGVDTTGYRIAHSLASKFDLVSSSLRVTLGGLFPGLITGPKNGGPCTYSQVFEKFREPVEEAVLEGLTRLVLGANVYLAVSLEPRKGENHPIKGHKDAQIYLVLQVTNPEDDGDFFINEAPIGICYNYDNPSLEEFVTAIANTFDSKKERILSEITALAPVWAPDKT